MKGRRNLAVGCIVVPALAFATLVPAQSAGKQSYRESFAVDRASLADTGRSSYFILEPGYRLTFQHGKDTLIVTVLEETRMVDGVRTRIVEERETEGGQLAEVSRNFFAIDRTAGDVYYFGEDVDEYKNGKVTGHAGAWLSGVNGARFGLMVPGTPKAGDRFYRRLRRDRDGSRRSDQRHRNVKVPAGSY
jgi:hypothetical protein